MTNIKYKRYSDYLFPEIEIKEIKGSLGKYGTMRRSFLKEHKPMTYNDMVLAETLFSHLYKVQEEASKRLEVLMEQLLEAIPAPIKKENQMVWVQHMNLLKAQAEELVLEELVYC